MTPVTLGSEYPYRDLKEFTIEMLRSELVKPHLRRLNLTTLHDSCEFYSTVANLLGPFEFKHLCRCGVPFRIVCMYDKVVDKAEYIAIEPPY